MTIRSSTPPLVATLVALALLGASTSGARAESFAPPPCQCDDDCVAFGYQYCGSWGHCQWTGPGTPCKVDQGVPEQGVTDFGVPEQGVSDFGAPDQGVPDQGVPDQGVPDQSVPDQGVPRDQGAGDLAVARDSRPSLETADWTDDVGASDPLPERGGCAVSPSAGPSGLPLVVLLGLLVLWRRRAPRRAIRRP